MQNKPLGSKMLAGVAKIVACLLLRHGTGLAADATEEHIISHGRYLSVIGACAACHTPAKLPGNAVEGLKFRADPNWFEHLDHERNLGGGVPFILRFSSASHGLVVTPNITPHEETGIGKWSKEQIAEVLRSGKRPDGRALFRFPPHTFYENLAEDDLMALAAYLKSTKPVENKVPSPDLPFAVAPGNPPKLVKSPPDGRTTRRAEYLMASLVGCIECHSHHDPSTKKLRPFLGGRIGDAFAGGFRLGPDLPIEPLEKGFAAWPYPGFGLLYGGNLTRFGLGGDLSSVSAAEIVHSIRSGMSTRPDDSGRARPLAHTMLWQFYSSMNDNDTFAIAEYLKALRYEPGPLDGKERLLLFGTDSKKAFEIFFGEPPSEQDIRIFKLR